MISVSYFDQSVFFLYLVLAAIGSIQAGAAVGVGPEPEVDANWVTLREAYDDP